MANTKLRLETKEVELPETLYVRDIENRVFQGIVLQCLAKIKGISLIEGNLIDSIFNLGASETVKGIYADQNSNSQSVDIKIEVNICYGETIPEKAEEIQTKIAEEITQFTGLHVSSVHVVFKNVITPEAQEKLAAALRKASSSPIIPESTIEEEYSEEF
ncbi:MAG: Asp23/Gls24 family envelope stress response protein [Chlamydiota bacterium]